MRHVITRQLFQAQNRLFAPLFAPKVRFSVTQNLLYDVSIIHPGQFGPVLFRQLPQIYSIAWRCFFVLVYG